MNTPENLLGQSDLEPYILTSPADILDILQSIRNRNATLRTLLEPISVTTATSLIDINTRQGTLVLRMSPSDDELEPSDFLSAEKILSDTSLGASHVQFAGNDAMPHDHDKHAALRIPIPSQLMHVQRRDSYRILTPVTSPVNCNISPGSSKAPVALSIADISLGGVCLTTEQQDLDYIVGKIYPDCSIDLPGVGSITVALQVAHVTQQPSALGITRYRIGCSFVQPNYSASGAVQRYISQLEREEIAKKRGFI
ncbi:flagellar brake protein [Eoetvoesiella caeni]